MDGKGDEAKPLALFGDITISCCNTSAIPFRAQAEKRLRRNFDRRDADCRLIWTKIRNAQTKSRTRTAGHSTKRTTVWRSRLISTGTRSWEGRDEHHPLPAAGQDARDL